MREKEIARMYFKELGFAIMIYMFLLVGGIVLAKQLEPGALRTVVLVLPMIGFLLAIWAIARQVRRMDEYQRILILESFAIAAAITAGLSFTYGFLESAGYPRLSMFWVWGVMGGSWFLVALVRNACLRFGGDE
jgi:hypothetical protein